MTWFTWLATGEISRKLDVVIGKMDSIEKGLEKGKQTPETNPCSAKVQLIGACSTTSNFTGII